MHVYDPAFSSSGALPPRSGRLADYMRVRERLGLERVIVVQPTAYGTDNRCTLDAIRKLGPGARGIAVVDLDVTDAQLRQLTEAGIRGQRYVMFPGRPLTWESMPAIAARVAPFGWHINLQLAGEELVQRESMLAKLPCSLVIDHIGRFTAPLDDSTPGVRAMHRMLDSGRCWVKLSAPYHGSRSGPPHYEDIGALARELVARWPERLLSATNWPHPSVKGEPPDDLALFSLLAAWAPNEATRRRILVENPETLYGFPRST